MAGVELKLTMGATLVGAELRAGFEDAVAVGDRTLYPAVRPALVRLRRAGRV